MATYAIGDLQGCYCEFKSLLKKINFNQNRDQLWLVGDLVNRGPASLETLQFIYQLNDCIKVVLGNHDLHLIGCAYGARTPKPGDTLDPLLKHPSADILIAWLKQQPLLVDDAELGFCMTHAGIPHIWHLSQIKQLALETEHFLRNDTTSSIHQLFSNNPDSWSESLQGQQRYIAIINYLTRMRFINAKGTLNLKEKGTAIANENQTQTDSFRPWFCFDISILSQRKLIFGHWAALQGKTDRPNIFALDTGCVWGGSLTALRLEDLQLFQVPSAQPK